MLNGRELKERRRNAEKKKLGERTWERKTVKNQKKQERRPYTETIMRESREHRNQRVFGGEGENTENAKTEEKR